jgi:hypothetical protein
VSIFGFPRNDLKVVCEGRHKLSSFLFFALSSSPFVSRNAKSSGKRSLLRRTAWLSARVGTSYGSAKIAVEHYFLPREWRE